MQSRFPLSYKSITTPKNLFLIKFQFLFFIFGEELKGFIFVIVGLFFICLIIVIINIPAFIIEFLGCEREVISSRKGSPPKPKREASKAIFSKLYWNIGLIEEFQAFLVFLGSGFGSQV